MNGAPADAVDSRRFVGRACNRDHTVLRDASWPTAL